MPSANLSNVGRQLLDRRSFLGHAAGGLSGVALASLLARDGLLAAEENEPWQPHLNLAAPLRARPPHFAAKAKRVLMIFCSGACSQIDTWDYKPDLIKYDGKPMPGHENVVTFQGQLGNVTKSPWQFRPRGQCGKYTSDLLPQLSELVDDMCFIHSMTSKTNGGLHSQSQPVGGFFSKKTSMGVRKPRHARGRLLRRFSTRRTS